MRGMIMSVTYFHMVQENVCVLHVISTLDLRQKVEKRLYVTSMRKKE